MNNQSEGSLVELPLIKIMKDPFNDSYTDIFSPQADSNGEATNFSKVTKFQIYKSGANSPGKSNRNFSPRNTLKASLMKKFTRIPQNSKDFRKTTYNTNKRSKNKDILHEFSESTYDDTKNIKVIKKNIDDALNYTACSPLNQESQRRNQQVYELLEKYNICVIPNQKIQSLDQLPHFEFVENVNHVNADAKRRERLMRQENRQRVKNKLINSSVNENDLGNRGIKLTSLDFNHQLNQYQMQGLKLSKPKEFFSPSLRVTNYGLIRSKILASELSKDLGFELGNYVNKMLEKQIDKADGIDPQVQARSFATNGQSHLRITETKWNKWQSSLNTNHLDLYTSITKNNEKLKTLEQNYSQQKRKLELQILRENYKNLPTQRILDRMRSQRSSVEENSNNNQTQKISLYRPNYRHRNFQEQILYQNQSLEQVRRKRFSIDDDRSLCILEEEDC